jgi:hypothetical protein
MLRMYDFKCKRCGAIRERFVQEDERVLSDCCGSDTDRLPPIVRVNMGASGAYGYYDDTLGTYITSNRHRREVMRQQGVSEKGATPKPDGEAWV